MTIGYGQTEASPIITQTSVDDSIEIRASTVGRPIPGVDVKLVDPASRREGLPARPVSSPHAGTTSWPVIITIPMRPRGAVDAEGWLYTGDLACRRDDGNYRIVGPL